MDIVDKQKFIFFSKHLLENKLQAVGNHVLDDGVTISQWLLIASIEQFRELLHFSVK